jgi:hypothetical protein
MQEPQHTATKQQIVGLPLDLEASTIITNRAQGAGSTYLCTTIAAPTSALLSASSMEGRLAAAQLGALNSPFVPPRRPPLLPPHPILLRPNTTCNPGESHEQEISQNVSQAVQFGDAESEESAVLLRRCTGEK